MGVGVFLTLLPTLETLFFLLVCLVQLRYEGFYLVLLYLVLSYLVALSWRPVFSKKEIKGKQIWGRGKVGWNWEEWMLWLGESV